MFRVNITEGSRRNAVSKKREYGEHVAKQLKPRDQVTAMFDLFAASHTIPAKPDRPPDDGQGREMVPGWPSEWLSPRLTDLDKILIQTIRMEERNNG